MNHRSPVRSAPSRLTRAGAAATLAFTLGVGCAEDDATATVSGTADTAISDATPGDAPGGNDAADVAPAEDVPVDDPLAEAGFPLAVDASGFTLGPLSSAQGGGGAYEAPFSSRSGTETVKFVLGYYTFEEEVDAWTRGGLGADGAATNGFGATVTAEGEGTVALDVTSPGGANRTSIAFQCKPTWRFLGLGAQTPAMEHRGARVPIWVTEQGVGQQKDLPEDEFNISFKGHWYDSYFPVPVLVIVDEATGESFGLLVDGTERIVFELCSARDNAFRIERWAGSLRLTLFKGPSPVEVVKRAVAVLGKPPMPPAWAFLPWIAIKGGPAKIEDKLDVLATAAIPAAAIWSEDWLGEEINPITGFNIKYHWEWDEEHFPGLPELTAALHADDLRFLGYFNPFITTDFREWQEALAGGFLPKDPAGEPYDFAVLTNEGSVVDLTLEAAREWLLGYMQKGRELGLDGWMADFAEWVPYDATFADGRTGASVSSDYPRIWQDLNRQVCPPEDCVFFVRSGFTGSSALATAAWGGDQNTDFGEDDGLPTAVRIGVGLGLAGVGFYGSDIAGYTSTAGVKPSDQELYFRWTQLGAWSPIMRTHEGNAGPKNHQFDTNPETLAHFKQYADVHTRLYPYLRGLMAEATETGLTPIRHPALHEPTAGTLASRDTYLLGERLLVAPVVARGATTRTLALPPGTWVDLRDGERYAGGATITVDAPIDEIPVFLGDGAVVPQLPQAVLRPALAATGEAGVLEVHAVAGRDGRFRLATGVEFVMTSESATDPGPLGLPACDGDARPCSDRVANVRRYRVAAGGGLEGEGFGFARNGDGAAGFDVLLRVAP